MGTVADAVSDRRLGAIDACGRDSYCIQVIYLQMELCSCNQTSCSMAPRLAMHLLPCVHL